MMSPGSSGPNPRTADQILDGAIAAIARFGLNKFGMEDVADAAELSRGTVYRYFRTRDDLLASLASRESQRIQDQLARAIAESPSHVPPIHVLLTFASNATKERPLLAELLSKEPGFVLTSLQESFKDISRGLRPVFSADLRELAGLDNNTIPTTQLIDWITRLLIAGYLFPDPNPERMLEVMASMQEMLKPKPNGASASSAAKAGAKKKRLR